MFERQVRNITAGLLLTLGCSFAHAELGPDHFNSWMLSQLNSLKEMQSEESVQEWMSQLQEGELSQFTELAKKALENKELNGYGSNSSDANHVDFNAWMRSQLEGYEQLDADIVYKYWGSQLQELDVEKLLAMARQSAVAQEMKKLAYYLHSLPAGSDFGDLSNDAQHKVEEIIQKILSYKGAPAGSPIFTESDMELLRSFSNPHLNTP